MLFLLCLLWSFLCPFYPLPTVLPFFAYLSSFLYSHLWTPPFSLTLKPAYQPFPTPPGEYVPLHGVNHLIFSYYLSVSALDNLWGSHNWEITAVNTLAVSTWMWFAAPELFNICVSGLAKGLPTLYSRAGLRKMVSCGGLRPRPFPLPLLSGVLSTQGISPLWLPAEMGC